MGGAELQQAIIGRCLQKNGHEVSFATTVFDGRRDDEIIDGMKIYKTFDSEDGLPGLRLLHPRLTKLWQTLKKADADIYYQRCADRVTGICELFCRRYGRTFVHSGAHDSDFSPRPDLRMRERIPYQWGLRRADLVLVQSEQQKRLLKQNYGKDGYVLPNVYPKRSLTTCEGYVLWVGSMRDFRRPMHCLEIAKRFPNVKFIMIGGPGNRGTAIYDQVHLEAKNLPNVECLGFQTLEVTERYFDGASLLLNTSSVEGFPNTYLQAWSRGIPTVGFFDPDNMIAKNDFGRVVSEVSEFGDWLDSLRNAPLDQRQRIQVGFENQFTPQRYVDGFIDLLDQLDQPSTADSSLGMNCAR
ncbi:hypothetical protein CA13_35800 [Planctomycetes bacterium CA13]|uniref:Glycosyltransferase subfamily 4-like N-terminal domain-containing protein n=2 Tax=Novipirellula herctigrandis TaxID=2527986 RepID=A0A5C5Z412_9BACT|nr:hypothetical protein CA13_35800 [Planctomycetes bacterium CA13]